MNKELTVVENGLVPVYETSTGEKVVYGTELHAVLGVRTSYKDWSERRLNDIDALENEDYEAAQICAPSGQSRKEHIIKLDTAKEMAMLERNAKGKQVRRYFIQIEKKYKATQELIEKKMKDMLQFIEQQSEINQMILEKIDSIQIRQNGNSTIDSDSISIKAESESKIRRKELNRLVGKMAKVCGWDRNFALHRLYKTLEGVLDISLDNYLEIYQEERNMHTSTLEMVTEYDRLYNTAVRLCINTINSMKC